MRLIEFICEFPLIHRDVLGTPRHSSRNVQIRSNRFFGFSVIEHAISLVTVLIMLLGLVDEIQSNVGVSQIGVLGKGHERIGVVDFASGSYT
jgi:hypothetical protein